MPAARPSSAPRAAGSAAPARMRLAEAGCEVVVNGRDPKRLEAHRGRDRARRPAPRCIAVVADVGDRRKARPRCSPPARSRTSWSTTMPARRSAISASSTAQKMIDGVIGNMIVPIELIQKAIDPMVEEQVRPHRQHHVGLGEDAAGRARPVVRRARGADRVPRRRRALGRASTTSPSTSCCPGPFDTDRLRSNMRDHRQEAGHHRRAGARPTRIATVPAKRFGEPDEFGAACAFLCSAHAGFITGQNLLIDGGIFPGAF